MIKQHVEQPEGSEPMGVCDCGFTADECGTNPCMRKKIHLAGLTPGSKWPNTGQPAPAAPSSASVAGDTRSADAPRKALDGAGWPSRLSSKCPRCLCTPLHCNCDVYPQVAPVAWRHRNYATDPWIYSTEEPVRASPKVRGAYIPHDAEIEPLYAAPSSQRSAALQALADIDRDLIGHDETMANLDALKVRR
jgi:hypothetical protein